MKAYLRAQSLWDVVENGVDPPVLRANPTLAQIKKHEEDLAKKPKALTCLNSALSDVIFTRIMACETPKEVWDKLRDEFEGSERVKMVKLLTLKREFEMLRMKDGETVKEYSSKLLDIVNKIRLLGEDFSNLKVVEKMLISLPTRFEAKISAIEESCDLKSLTVAKLIRKTPIKERSKYGSDKSGKNEAAGNFKEAGKQGKFPPWHIDKACRLKQKQANKQKQVNEQPQQHVNVADEQEDATDKLFMVSNCNMNWSDQMWFVDSGCTSHMSKDKRMFSSLNKSVKTSVRLGDGRSVQVEGKGSNLLTVAQILNKGYSLSFKDKKCSIYDSNDELLVNVPMIDISFSLKLNEACEDVNCVVNDDSLLWHRRYGHFYFAALRNMSVKGFKRDLPEIAIEDYVCGACKLGKMHRLSFPAKSTWRAKSKLELVHSDVCGPMSTESLSKNKYFVLFIDDFTRMTWVYFLSCKGQVFSIFKKYKAMVESQSGCMLKCLRTYNGKEYTSNEFNNFCADLGISYQLTTSYSPQQNGVSERKNRTVVEMARCMMMDKKLPLKFWAEAVYAVVYLLNRLPTKGVEGMTPIEAWSKVKPTTKHLKTFGSVCYFQIPNAKRSKLEQKAEMGIFLGYASMTKGCRIYNVQTNKVMISRDVAVDENSHWNWENVRVELDDICSKSASLPLVKTSRSLQHDDKDEKNSEDSSLDSPILKTNSLSEIYEKCTFTVMEPSTFEEVLMHDEWKNAMKEDMRMIEKNRTWSLVPRPRNRHVIGVKWIFRTKLNPDGSINKYKARLVVKGYSQLAGVD
ncbi:UNVERIFIED_CONTAM: Retrovirus-related Pol polyprotein from transposon TNT 1-94 [Sesamum latifolium]|uniref:Retrovirus-related Pol polyprotein from transposon TNT 1-94 n=1 Tax=Sesamum latifolium TaxID=2727402 RepID=A0AAW2UFH9_9LAMI